jgi:iron donor protein CyaY
MSESEFLDLAESTLNQIEAALDRLNDEDVVDVECKRSGNVLEIEFIDNGSKIIINSQAPMQEMWVAARRAASTTSASAASGAIRATAASCSPLSQLASAGPGRGRIPVK